MNTQLKKGDKCQFQHLTVTVCGFFGGQVEIFHDQENGGTMLVSASELTRIPSHAERMQAIIDLAFNAENALDDNDTVQLKVGEFVEFARHYCAIADQLDECIQCFKLNAKTHLTFAKETEKILKEEEL
jgi:hypothetical protein